MPNIPNPLTNITIPSATPLSHYALIRVSGTAASAFLQGQLSNDISHLQNKSCLAAHCNNKGRVRALYRVFQHGDDFYLRCPRTLLDQALSFLQHYARFSKVTLTPVQDFVGYGILIPKDKEKELPFPALAINETTVSEQHHILRIPDTEQWNRYEIYTFSQTQEKSNTIATYLKNLPPITPEIWLLSDILSGIPDIFPETSEKFLPHYINLPQLGAISFTKGCYVGQEIVARMEYRSQQIKYHLALVQLPLNPAHPAPKPGDTLPDKVSTVVSAAISPIRQLMHALIQTPLVTS